MTPEELAKSGSEHGNQRAFFAALQQWSPVVNEHTFAIPNGGSRGDTRQSRAQQGAKLKAEGVKSGVPDVMVAWPYGGYAGLFVEMKRPADRATDRARGRLGDNQDPWHARLRGRGYAVIIAYTWQEALAAVQSYFGQLALEAGPVNAGLVIPARHR